MNENVSLTGGGDYQTALARLMRQQQFADQSQREAMEPLQAPQGAVAPISWTNVLAKAMQGWGARRQSDKIDERYQQLGQQDRSAADALVAQLTKQTPAVQGPQTTVSGTLPSLPGQTAPQPQGPQVPLQMPTAAPQAAMSPDQQMAAILAAHGGPETQAIKGALLPYLMQRQNKEWEADQPMTRAAREQGEMQLRNQEEGARFANQLPETAAQRATSSLGWAQLGETKDYHKALSGGLGMTEDGRFSPVVQSHGTNILAGNENLGNVPMAQRGAVSMWLAQNGGQSFSPTAAAKNTLASSRITAPYTNMAAYKLTADGLPYIQRIDAAFKHPGSVSDQDLLDSLTKLNTGGNAVTDAQVSLITHGKSFADSVGVWGNYVRNGGVLSDNQRAQIRDIANDIFANYKKGYQPVYEAATKQLSSAGIPKAFWTIPDLNSLNAGQSVAGGGSGGGASGPSPAEAAAELARRNASRGGK